MQKPLSIHFNRLPAEVRSRFVVSTTLDPAISSNSKVKPIQLLAGKSVYTTAIPGLTNLNFVLHNMKFGALVALLALFFLGAGR